MPAMLNLRLLRDHCPASCLVLISLLLSACGGGGGYGGGGGSGYSSSSSYSSSVSSSSSSSSVATTQLFSVSVQPQQIFPAVTSSATAAGSITIDLTSGAASGTVTLAGITAAAVTINDAFAGNSGAAILTLTQSTTNANVWNVASGAMLTTPQLADLSAGKLYVLVTSAAHPQGEIRGQVLPDNVTVVFADTSGTQEVPAITTTVTGSVAVTVNNTSKKAAVNVNVSTNNATGAELLTGSSSTNGTLLVALASDNAVPGHWLNESITLTDADIANYNSSKWYVNVYTAAHASGETRAQVAQTPMTLTQLQANIFTPNCSSCHTGTASNTTDGLPGVQNLTSTATTFAALVNTNSIEQSALKRIKPNDPDNSYLVRKIEGDPSITGVRMPFGGQLTQVKIDQIRAWVTAGAPNN